jgi:hypothetical protein
LSEDHQQAEAHHQELELEEESPIAESSVKTYSDALKHLKDLENFALTRNDSDLFETIFRARMMTENHAINQQVTFKNLYLTTGKNEQLFQ